MTAIHTFPSESVNSLISRWLHSSILFRSCLSEKNLLIPGTKKYRAPRPTITHPSHGAAAIIGTATPASKPPIEHFPRLVGQTNPQSRAAQVLAVQLCPACVGLVVIHPCAFAGDQSRSQLSQFAQLVAVSSSNSILLFQAPCQYVQHRIQSSLRHRPLHFEDC